MNEFTHPNIAAAILELASYNGAFHRGVTKEELLTAGFEPLRADGVYQGDVNALERWLGTLSEEERFVVLEGEQSEQEAITANAPMGEAGYRVSDLITDIWEAL